MKLGCYVYITLVVTTLLHFNVKQYRRFEYVRVYNLSLLPQQTVEVHQFKLNGSITRAAELMSFINLLYFLISEVWPCVLPLQPWVRTFLLILFVSPDLKLSLYFAVLILKMCSYSAREIPTSRLLRLLHILLSTSSDKSFAILFHTTWWQQCLILSKLTLMQVESKGPNSTAITHIIW